MAAMIPTTRHLQYARGYIDLGMVDEASDELESIDWDDRMTPQVLAVRVDLYHAAKNWELMADIAKHLAESLPEQPQWWVQWASEKGSDHVLCTISRLPQRRVMGSVQVNGIFARSRKSTYDGWGDFDHEYLDCPLAFTSRLRSSRAQRPKV